MRFDLDAADIDFRLRARAVIQDKLRQLSTRSPGHHGFHAPTVRAWTRLLDQEGWAVPYWPREWGGTDWPATFAPILDEEFSAALCPPTDVIGIGFVGPVLYTFGNLDQKQRYLPKIRTAEHLWCQGFSEPGAGSDVLALRTVAISKGDRYIVNGHKLWTSNAHNSDMMFALVRIDTPGNRKQQGVSFLLIDMRSAGLSVRPVVTIDGQHWINEVLLENVEVPVENLVGEPGQGWVYARFLLANERTLVAGLAVLRRVVAEIKHLLDDDSGHPAGATALHRARLAEFEIELKALEFMELRILYARDDASVKHTLAPMLKLRGSELRQRLSEFWFELSGDEALEFLLPRAGDSAQQFSESKRRANRCAVNHLFQRSATIAGGTSEIQRNIIAGVSLGL
jgi:acyl-CoA dehydrogenase